MRCATFRARKILDDDLRAIVLHTSKTLNVCIRHIRDLEHACRVPLGAAALVFCHDAILSRPRSNLLSYIKVLACSTWGCAYTGCRWSTVGRSSSKRRTFNQSSIQFQKQKIVYKGQIHSKINIQKKLTRN